ncbi:hypothetical protein CYLTODRAFT_444755 [Cylindrobasidium torrendii FP15055 ss-10]|uniref:Uncharacterized protein n=1 Tax=Cylindrobasidium torrendii FP15055 ss-10 TaxID=1314674 RepID=A0A0D7B9Y2_9AGAR|nr:hypothetical protein CYLTODRAFT_444755 [Cylindrobasidium torrendii FP15055 ss-10]
MPHTEPSRRHRIGSYNRRVPVPLGSRRRRKTMDIDRYGEVPMTSNCDQAVEDEPQRSIILDPRKNSLGAASHSESTQSSRYNFWDANSPEHESSTRPICFNNRANGQHGESSSHGPRMKMRSYIRRTTTEESLYRLYNTLPSDERSMFSGSPPMLLSELESPRQPRCGDRNELDQGLNGATSAPRYDFPVDMMQALRLQYQAMCDLQEGESDRV